jgi:GntR family transcriptional regulator, transcriptional repressor for pyruvate dehydrogenase complex
MTTLQVRRIGPAYQQVADELRALIVSGGLSAGQRLPPEQELGAAFGVSRSTLREALRVLSSQHLITTARGVQGGTFVAAPAPGSVSDYLETSIGLMAGADEVDVDQLLEARDLLEVPAAALAARRRRSSHLAELRETLSQGRAADQRFHTVIVSACGNPLLDLMCGPVFSVLRDRFLRDLAPESFWTLVHHDHLVILDAIESRDAGRAADEMRTHLKRLAATYRRIDRMSRP